MTRQYIVCLYILSFSSTKNNELLWVIFEKVNKTKSSLLVIIEFESSRMMVTISYMCGQEKPTKVLIVFYIANLNNLLYRACLKPNRRLYFELRPSSTPLDVIFVNASPENASYEFGLAARFFDSSTLMYVSIQFVI